MVDDHGGGYSLCLGLLPYVWLFAHSLRGGARRHILPLLLEDPPNQRLSSPVLAAGRYPVGHRQLVRPGADHHRPDPGPDSDHVCGPDHRPAGVQKATPGGVSPVSNVAVSLARVVCYGLLALHLPSASLRAPGLAVHALRAGGLRQRRRSLPAAGPQATVLAFCLVHTPSRYSFALKVEFSTSHSHVN